MLYLIVVWAGLVILLWWGWSVFFPPRADAAMRLDSVYDFHCACYPTRRELIVYDSQGGNIQRAIDTFSNTIAEGRRINIYGYCFSSCTTALEHASTCWDEGALFGFHAGTIRQPNQAQWEAVYSPLATKEMWARWPQEIRDLFGTLEAVPIEYVYLTGQYLHALTGRGVCA